MIKEKISVIMPAYNAEATIKEAIDSILSQTYRDFEFIIINDGSRDTTENIIKSYNDSRIKLLNNDINRGLIYSLNRGINSATGDLLARMDADDISLPERFEKQVDCFLNNPRLIACGTKIEYFGNTKLSSRKYITKVSDKENKKLLLFTACFAHPTVMLRRDILTRHNLLYDESFKNCEDYKFWIDLMEYGEFYNIPEVLLKYRQSDTQITHAGISLLKENSKKCRRIYINKQFPELDLSESPSLRMIRHLPKDAKYKELRQLLYLSLPTYRLDVLLQVLFSKDFLSFSFYNILALLKRIFGKGEPLL